ncbi:hypothetical protein ACWEGE_22950 [Amycolatopsis sp. NPDC004747]
MEIVFIVAILAPCSLAGLLVLVTAVRPSAAPALAMVLSAITRLIEALARWFESLTER